MAKKKQESELRKHQIKTTLNKDEHELFLKQLTKAGGMKQTKFVRHMLTQGYVHAQVTREDKESLIKIHALLLEYKTNFMRISNFMKYTDPALARLCRETAEGISKKLKAL